MIHCRKNGTRRDPFCENDYGGFDVPAGQRGSAHDEVESVAELPSRRSIG